MAAERELSMVPKEVDWLRRRVRRWYSEHGRRFPWRETSDPFHVLIAELLLQRTRADLVPAVYERFVQRYPDPQTLADASVDDVVEQLRPLGFLHRSARLPTLGRALVERFGGVVPQTEAELLTLPGVGRYIANAVLVLAFGKRRPLLDPNVIRLLDRFVGLRSTRSRPREDPRLWSALERITSGRNPREAALGLIDLGALICLPRRPRCGSCPLRARCLAFQTKAVDPEVPPRSH